MSDPLPVAIIGAGPAGLAVSALLSRQHIRHTIYEKEPTAGGLYATLNPDLVMLSPPFFNALPGAKYRDPTGNNTVGAYRRYLQDYIDKYQPPLQLNTSISKVSREAAGYRLLAEQGDTIDCTRLVIATGAASFPRPLPFTPPDSIELQTGRQWQGVDYYRDKNVLVVGSGTSALELASLLAGHTSTWLATNKPVEAIPLYIVGINFHWLVRALELLPKALFPNVCHGSFREPPINQHIKQDIRQGRVTLVNADIRFEAGQTVFADGSKEKIDTIINCTGYRYDIAMLPLEVSRYANGHVITRQNQSISHPGLYLIGHPCAGGIDSKFLRGIRRDAWRIMRGLKAT